jgi:hypothetical protein
MKHFVALVILMLSSIAFGQDSRVVAHAENIAPTTPREGLTGVESAF